MKGLGLALTCFSDVGRGSVDKSALSHGQVMKLADMQDLGSCALSVRVRVPSCPPSPPYEHHKE